MRVCLLIAVQMVEWEFGQDVLEMLEGAPLAT